MMTEEKRNKQKNNSEFLGRFVVSVTSFCRKYGRFWESELYSRGSVIPVGISGVRVISDQDE
jgi:hypothetical protein